MVTEFSFVFVIMFLVLKFLMGLWHSGLDKNCPTVKVRRWRRGEGQQHLLLNQS
jgi:hypothetical protein